MQEKLKPGFYREQQRDALELMDYFSWNKVKLINESPRAFFRNYRHGKVFEGSRATEFGHLVHMAALEPAKFREHFVLEPEFTGYTKEGKLSNRSASAIAKRDAWYASLKPGALVVSEKDRDALVEIVEHLMEHPRARQLLSGGRAEGWGYAWDPHFGRWQLIRTDFITQDLIAVEIKTTSKKVLTPRAWAREAFFMGYHGQLAHNARGIGLLHGLENNRRGAWIVIQSVPPYDVAVYPAGESVMLAGEDLCFRGYHKINELLASDPKMENSKLWHGCQGHKVEEVNFEPWMLSQDPGYDDLTQFGKA